MDIQLEIHSWMIPIIRYNQVLKQLMDEIHHSWFRRGVALSDQIHIDIVDEHHIRYKIWKTNSWHNVRVEYQWDMVNCACCDNELSILTYFQPISSVLKPYDHEKLFKVYYIS